VWQLQSCEEFLTFEEEQGMYLIVWGGSCNLKEIRVSLLGFPFPSNAA